MNGLSKISNFRSGPTRDHRFWWLLTTIGLIGLYLLARIAQPLNLAPYRQLVVLYIIDSFLFFLTDRVLAKMGVLTLIFLLTMEVIVAIFYLISIFGSTRY